MVAQEQGTFYRPKSPVELVLSGDETRGYINDIARLMQDGSRWGGIPLRYHTTELNCLTFRLGVGGVTITHDRVIQPSLSRPMHTYNDVFASVDETVCGVSYKGGPLSDRPVVDGSDQDQP